MTSVSCSEVNHDSWLATQLKHLNSMGSVGEIDDYAYRCFEEHLRTLKPNPGAELIEPQVEPEAEPQHVPVEKESDIWEADECCGGLPITVCLY